MQPNMVEQVAQMLNTTLNNSTPSNVQVNRNLWDTYARDWDNQAGYVKQMTSDVSKEFVSVLGEEWSDNESFLQVCQEMILPYVEGVCLEIGVGGGRVAKETVGKCE